LVLVLAHESPRRVRCAHGLISRPRIQQGRRDGGSGSGVGVEDRQPQFSAAGGGEERPDQGDRAGNERRRGARSAERERISLAAQARYLLAGSKQALTPDRTAKIGVPQGRAAKVAGADRNNPWMSGDDGAADGALVAGRCHDEDASPGGVIERLEK